MSEAPQVGVPIDLASGDGRAVLWGLASDDLNVNLVAWPAGDGVDEHRNAARDVLIVVVAGALTVTLDGVSHHLAAGTCLVIPKGTTRELRAAEDGARYLTVHWKRPGLTIDA